MFFFVCHVFRVRFAFFFFSVDKVPAANRCAFPLCVENCETSGQTSMLSSPLRWSGVAGTVTARAISGVGSGPSGNKLPKAAAAKEGVVQVAQ